MQPAPLLQPVEAGFEDSRLCTSCSFNTRGERVCTDCLCAVCGLGGHGSAPNAPAPLLRCATCKTLLHEICALAAGHPVGGVCSAAGGDASEKREDAPTPAAPLPRIKIEGEHDGAADGRRRVVMALRTLLRSSPCQSFRRLHTTCAMTSIDGLDDAALPATAQFARLPANERVAVVRTPAGSEAFGDWRLPPAFATGSDAAEDTDAMRKFVSNPSDPTALQKLLGAKVTRALGEIKKAREPATKNRRGDADDAATSDATTTAATATKRKRGEAATPATTTSASPGALEADSQSSGTAGAASPFEAQRKQQIQRNRARLEQVMQ